MRRVIFDQIGGPEVLRIKELELPPPGEDEVTIDIRAIGLNRFESQFRRNTYAVSPILPSGIGAEATGIVRHVGLGVENFAPGDRVAVLPVHPCVGTGLCADAANVPASAVVPALHGSQDGEEASFWCAYLTAYELLSGPELPSGSLILVTAAASSVGVALLQMIRDRGYRSIATTRSSSKVPFLKKVGADEVIVTNEEPLSAGVSRISGGTGVSMALDALAGRFTAEVVASTSEGGAIRLYGALSESSMAETRVELSMFSLYRKTIGFTSIYSLISDPDRFAEAMQHLRDGNARGAFKPKIDRTFPLGEIVEAYRHLESGDQQGKIIVFID